MRNIIKFKINKIEQKNLTKKTQMFLKDLNKII